tara:strand:- start:276 stop:719 length:444 start_codon:yes stop_codon:yes gene_type:complete
MTITINGSGTITGASTLATTVASPTLTTPNIDSAQFATVSGTAPIYPCRAWCRFTGTTTGTNAPTAGGNVSTVTRNSTGDYTINFTTAMPDANYAFICTASFASDGSVITLVSATTTALRITTDYVSSLAGASTPLDTVSVNVAIFR